MTLFTQTAETTRWISRVLSVFLWTRPGITLATICCSAISQITRLLAFFLPLKVILLAGSDGVPRYFRFFIDPDAKPEWIIGLSVSAVTAYAATLILESVTARLAEAGSNRVLAGANQIAATRRYREKVRNYFAQFCEVAASKLFAATMLAALAFLNLLLFGILTGLMVMEYLLAAVILGRSAAIRPNRMQRFVTEKPAEYVQVCTSFNFLAGFFVILIPFLLGHPGNILIAILSVLMMRQGFSRLDGAVSLMVALSLARPQIDPLVFRDRKPERTERPGQEAFRFLFVKERRDQAARRVLLPLMDGQAECHTEWQDSTIPGIYTFRVTSEIREWNTVRHFQKHVFPAHSVHLLEHEELLFGYISREALKAPPLISRLSEAGFEFQICDYGTGEAVSVNDWKGLEPALFAYFWGVEPPARLVQAYETSSNTLVGRLSESFFDRVIVSVDTQEEQEILDRFKGSLSSLQDRLEAVPLYVVNPDLNPATVVRDDKDFYVMSWCRWSLEPIGYALPKVVPRNELEDLVGQAREARGLDKDILDVSHVIFAHQCREIDRMIVQENYKKALQQMKKILDGPIMSDVA